MDRNVIILIVLGVVNIPLYFMLGKAMFGDWYGFWECIKYWLQPDSWSFFKGEWGDDQWAEFKLALFIILCCVMVIAEFSLIRKHILKEPVAVTQPVQDSAGSMLPPAPR